SRWIAWFTRCWTEARVASGWTRHDEHTPDRQLRLLHVQRVSPARCGVRRRADRRPQRRDLVAGVVAMGLRCDRDLPRPRPAGALARLRRLRRRPSAERDTRPRRV